MLRTPARTYLTATLLALAAAAGGQWVEDSVDVGGAWVGDLVYNSREDVVYGRCQTAGIFFAIACSSNNLVAQWPLSRPQQMAYDSIDNKAYVAFYAGNEDSVAVIDGVTHQRIKAIPLASATTPVWDPVNNKVYVSCQRHFRLGVIDCTTDSLVGEIPVGDCALRMQLNTRHHKLYVQNYDDHTVSVVDLDTDSVIRTVYVGGYPLAGYYSAAVDKYYCDGSEVVTVIDGERDEVVDSIPLPTQTYARAMTGYDRTDIIVLGVYRYDSSWAYFLDGNIDSVLHVLPVGRGPRELHWSRASELVYCANSYSNTISVLSRDGTEVLATLPVGDDPFSLAYSPVHNRLYVGHLNSRKVYVIRDAVGGIQEPDVRQPVSCLRVHPNPFRAACDVVGLSGRSRVAVYARDGRLVRELTPGQAGAGPCSATWDGRDSMGREVESGVYFIREHSASSSQHSGVAGCVQVIKVSGR
ncbi:MAG: hypothetical protein JXA67_19880 [Micromonosporaceae bacterium]|nr:hypothetical protein [Micromonosporaceae bacterium]